VKIDAPGHHTVSQCLFANGTSEEYGGNLYVTNADSIHISESIFEFGYAEIGGGGAAFVDTPVISVEGSFFESNQGGREGGGVLVSDINRNTIQDTSFIETFFGYNSAIVGGGFRTGASMLQLGIIDSYFEGNEASAFGGAGAIMDFSSIFLSGNKGENNFDLDGSFFFCNDFYIKEEQEEFFCAEVWEYVLLSSFSGSPAPSTPAGKLN
jgi:hypothetical protein